MKADVIVPVEETSPKEEYAAATIRSKIHKKLNHFLVPLKQSDPAVESLSLDFDSFDINDVGKAISKLHIDRSVQKVSSFQGGTKEARNHLEVFLEGKLDQFPELRNDPTLDYLSHMSPYSTFRTDLTPVHCSESVRNQKPRDRSLS